MTKYNLSKIHCNFGWGGSANGWYTDMVGKDNYRKPQGQSFNFARENRYCYLKVSK